jgi:hypothetical protein
MWIDSKPNYNMYLESYWRTHIFLTFSLIFCVDRFKTKLQHVVRELLEN